MVKRRSRKRRKRKSGIRRLKRLSKIPKRIGKRGAVSIRPISFHMDNRVDKYIVSGGNCEPVFTMNGGWARQVAQARLRVMEKRRKAKARCKKRRRKR